MWTRATFTLAISTESRNVVGVHMGGAVTTVEPEIPHPAPNKPRRSESARRARTNLPDQVDVAVIGSGLGGLVTAATLAERGHRVAVFESHYTAGGCATQFTRGPKTARYHFDVGLHYIGDCAEDGTIPRILRGLGIDIDYAELDPDGFDTLVFPDLRFRIPADLERYRERLVGLFPHESRGIERYVALVRSVMKVSRLLDVHEGKRPPLLELAKVAMDALRIGPHQNATIGHLLDGLVRDPRLKAVILGQSGDYGLPPSRASAILHMGLAGHYFRGAYYPKGGGQVIADRLCRRIEALGGSVHLRAPVERILVEAGSARGLRLAARAGEPAQDVRADVVVSNADITRTLVELVGPAHLPASWVRRAERFEMAAALFMTFVGLEGDGRDLGMTSSNTWQFDGYDVEGFYRNADSGTGDIGVRGCYVTSASLKDPANALHHAPAGHTNVEVMSIVPASPVRWGAEKEGFDWSYKHGETYAARKRALEAEMIRRLDALFPGAASRVVLSESASPLSHARFTGASGGTGYGLAATPEQFMRGRPGYRGPIAGLYLTGASTRAGHGIVGAMMGGRAAAGRIVRDLAEGRARSFASAGARSTR